MTLLRKIVFLILISSSMLYAQKHPGNDGYILGTAAVSSGILSNSIIDMQGSEYFDGVFLATGKGLSRFRASLQEVAPGEYAFIDSAWAAYTSADGLGKGGVSALRIKNDTIWVATAFDTTTNLGSYTAGGGIAWTANPDAGWTWMPQPMDVPADTSVVQTPTTTNIQNITYDIAITDTTIWTASFGGGLRKYSLQTGEWYNVPPDSDKFDAFAHLNHRAFAVITADTLLFTGTAAGINKSSDGGESWINYNYDDDGISGNFVTALAYQHHGSKDIIWAATWPTETGEWHSVSKSENWGLTWTVCGDMDGQFAHNFAFDDSIVYAATDEGLWKSVDYGDNWYLLPQPVGVNMGYSIQEPEAYAAAIYNDQLWLGTSDGLASTPDYGNTWFVYRAFVSTALGGEPDTYAYPTPFSPARWEAVRLQYNLTAPAYITIKVYDFAMDYVTTVCSGTYHSTPGDYYETWNGQNARGDVVANGVYFYRLEKSGQETAWGKIVILD